MEQIGRPAILKTAAFGYDGKGQQMITTRDDFEEIWSASSADELILEGVDRLRERTLDHRRARRGRGDGDVSRL